MKLEEKRDIIRAARNAGDSQADAIKGEISGLGIAKAGNEECDRLIAKYGLKPVAPVASAPAPAAAGALELAIAAAVAPHVGGKVDQAQFDALLAKSSELENRLNELAKAGPSTTIEIKASSGKVSSIGIRSSYGPFQALPRLNDENVIMIENLFPKSLDEAKEVYEKLLETLNH